MDKITSSCIAVLFILATNSSAVVQPAIAQPVESVAETAPFDVSYLSSASQWGHDTLTSAGITLPATTRIVYTNTDNCGAQASSAGMGGCTTTMEDGSYLVAISPALKYSAWGNHILFHEYAHTLGYGECAAEAYAHVYEGNADLWSYPECEEL
jgi:hypothetical protein